MMCIPVIIFQVQGITDLDYHFFLTALAPPETETTIISTLHLKETIVVTQQLDGLNIYEIEGNFIHSWAGVLRTYNGVYILVYTERLGAVRSGAVGASNC